MAKSTYTATADTYELLFEAGFRKNDEQRMRRAVQGMRAINQDRAIALCKAYRAWRGGQPKPQAAAAK